MIYHSAAFTDKGKRENNEDSYDFACSNDLFSAVVADGLGGHLNGEVASRIAVDSIMDHLECAEYDEDEAISAFLRANQNICSANLSGHSTAALLWLSKGKAIAAHVGDTRIYHFRNGGIQYQSSDHSVVQLSVSSGNIRPEDVRHHKDRNKLFRVLGDPNERLIVDSEELQVLPGDAFLICSDGFWEAVEEDKMLDTLHCSPTPKVWLDAMLDIVVAENDPKQDNYTAVCIYCEEE